MPLEYLPSPTATPGLSMPTFSIANSFSQQYPFISFTFQAADLNHALGGLSQSSYAAIIADGIGICTSIWFCSIERRRTQLILTVDYSRAALSAVL